MRYFDTTFFGEADKFIASLRPKTIKKILYNIDLSEQTNDPRLFKKLKKEIWEFRATYKDYRFAFWLFWDKTGNDETLVIATHGFIKKVEKVPGSEIDRALRIREQYFRNKAKR